MDWVGKIGRQIVAGFFYTYARWVENEQRDNENDDPYTHC